MNWVVLGGSGLTMIGLGLLGYCIYAAFSAKRSGLDDDALRARLQTVVALNMGALLISVIGLMAVVIGIFLG